MRAARNKDRPVRPTRYTELPRRASAGQLFWSREKTAIVKVVSTTPDKVEAEYVEGGPYGNEPKRFWTTLEELVPARHSIVEKRNGRAQCLVCGANQDWCWNRACDWCNQPEPQVGMGVTYGCWTDRYVGTIIEVSPTGKTFVMQADIAKRVDKNGMSESQTYEYTPNPNGEKITFRATTRKGRKSWRSGNYTAGVGHRNYYHDFSF